MKEKIKNLEELAAILEELKKRGKKIVFTNGCFDLLHIGHVRYLEEAKAQGDVLVVGVNSDQSVQSLKGPQRPIVPEKERIELLAALEVTDYLVLFAEATPESLINRLRPDIHVKGGDYRKEDLPEAALVESYGGQVVLVREVKGYSTSKLIKRIIENYSKEAGKGRRL